MRTRRNKMSPPAKRMKLTQRITSIEDLPPEMIGELFKCLQPRDLIMCSMVNKRWRSIYAGFKVHRLVASVDGGYDLHKWYYSNWRIEEAERCSAAIFIPLVKKPLLSNLRHLALCGYKFKFDLNRLNRFKQLVQLEISFGWFSKKKVNLKLPRLKVLAIHSYNERCPLSRLSGA